MKRGKIKQLRKVGIILFIAFIGFILLLFIFTSLSIGRSVRKQCLLAQEKYKTNCVESLILTLEDTKNSFRSRNFAIWALGQLGNKKALSSLEKLYTGNIPKKESLDKSLSQYELKKAIDLLKGFNATSFIWRNRLFVPNY